MEGLYMKKIISIAFTFLLIASSFAQKQSAAVSKIDTIAKNNAVPVLTLKEEMFNFGRIPQGKPVHHNFEVQNAGSTNFKLINVQASCGCTTPEWERDKEILPGQTSTITVGYNAAAEGVFTKSITITYGEDLSKAITIKGEVWKTPAASAPANSGTNELKD